MEGMSVHMQIRCIPVASPPDVDLLLSRLAEAGVNLVAVGGSDVEFGGELALVPEDGQEDLATGVLDEFGYPHRELFVDDPDSGLRLCLASHESGGLHQCLQEASISNRDKGWKIRDILVGVPDDDEFRAKKIPVQIYSEPQVAQEAES
jgi:hypothetical protein